MEMEITKQTFDSMLILLYKLGDYDACRELLKVYKRIYYEENESLH